MTAVRQFMFAAVAFAAFGLGAMFAFVPNDDGRFARLQIGNTSVIAEVARDASSRTRGLAGRDTLPRGTGMLFLFEAPGRYGIWMKGMKIPIDIFWIRNGRVVDMEERVLPPPAGALDIELPVYRPEAQADYVLEVGAGFAEEYGIRIGDSVKIFFEK